MNTIVHDAKKMSSYLYKGLVAGFVLGVITLVAVRFVTFKSDLVHYHANFALYINGQRDEFKNFSFYEEVQLCSSDAANNPKARVHMHDQNNHLIHVHAHGVTWSQFFTNLGYTLGDNLIKTDQGVYVDGQDGNKLTFLINGRETGTIADTVIKSEDVLLVNYGKDDQSTLQKRYDDIPRDAHQANTEKDPASCSGAESLTLTQRLKHAVGINEVGH